MSSLVWAIKFKLKNPDNASSFIEEALDGTNIIWIENLNQDGTFDYKTFKETLQRIVRKIKKHDIVGLDKPVYAGCNPDIVYHILSVAFFSNKSNNEFLVFLP